MKRYEKGRTRRPILLSPCTISRTLAHTTRLSAPWSTRRVYHTNVTTVVASKCWAREEQELDTFSAIAFRHSSRCGREGDCAAVYVCVRVRFSRLT